MFNIMLKNLKCGDLNEATEQHISCGTFYLGP